MKKLPLIALLALLPATITAQEDVISAFLEKWGNSKPYLLKIAKRMPVEHYDFKPVERQMTFHEQLLHIRENMLGLSEEYLLQQPSSPDTLKAENLTKKETIRLLDKAFEEVDKIVGNLEKGDLATEVDFFEGTKTKLQILKLIQDHLTHHRGQIIVYLNLKGFKTPEYVGW